MKLLSKLHPTEFAGDAGTFNIVSYDVEDVR